MLITVDDVIDVGFTISEIKDIFQTSNTVKDSDMKSSTTTLSSAVSTLAFNSVTLPESDESILFYTAGYIARKLVKQTKCASCKEMLFCKNAVIPLEAENENIDVGNRSEFLDLVDRGGLTLFRGWGRGKFTSPCSLFRI